MRLLKSWEVFLSLLRDLLQVSPHFDRQQCRQNDMELLLTGEICSTAITSRYIS
jgi:hypothetical protein